jgi:hypothetical protein
MVVIETTRKSLNVTTQREVKSIPNPAMRQYKTQVAHLRYPRLKGISYADIMETKIKSINSQRYAYESLSNEGEE